MELFEEIVNESMLLNELRTNRDDDIKKAINNVLRVRISYDDGKDKVISRAKGKRERYILPVAYGITKNGKRAIRAYQTAGSTKRGVPKWKLFLLDNIYNWSNGKKSFKEYGDTLIRLGLNTKGDKHMTTLYAITPIGGGGTPVAKSSKPIDTEPITKIDKPLEKYLVEEMQYSVNLIKPIIEQMKKVIEEESVHLEGANRLLELHEFSSLEVAKNFLNIIDEKDLMADMLNTGLAKDINVYIGEENEQEMLKDYSIVTFKHRIGNKDLGTIGIIGPKRMDYAKVISVMKYISKKLNDKEEN